MDGETSFEIPVRPERRYPRHGGVEYAGSTTFVLTPASDYTEPELEEIVQTVLADGPYRFGGFRSLPMPAFLVNDQQRSDVFRVSVRDDAIRLHVLPETEAETLAAVARRLEDTLDEVLTVDSRVASPAED